MSLDRTTLTIWGGEKGSPAYFTGTFDATGNVLRGEWVYPGRGYKSVMTKTAWHTASHVRFMLAKKLETDR
jgi:hypothetical protein